MSTVPVRILLAGEGAIAEHHMQALSKRRDIEVACLVGGVRADAERFAKRWSIVDVSLDYADCVGRDGIDAVILASPSPLHATQAEQAIAAGKHVLSEIPMSLNLADAERITALAEASGLVCMVAHTRRFNPPHSEIKRRLGSGEFQLQHLVSETYFFRRDNRNMQGKPRSWTDNLLWHHACHSVDLFAWLLDDFDLHVWASCGPPHPELGIAMDMNIGLRSASGVMATLVLSFNNRGPFGGFYRYIGEEDTLFAYRDELKDSQDAVIELSGHGGFAAQDDEFISAIHEQRRPQASFASCLPTMRLLERIEGMMRESHQ